MDDAERHQILKQKIEWMGKVYEAAFECEEYKWSRIEVQHRCGGALWVYPETTGIGYVCEKCKDAEVL